MRLSLPGLQGLLFAALSCVLCEKPVIADEPVRSDDALLTVRIDSLASLCGSPIARQVWELLRQSHQLQSALDTVEARKLREAVSFLEQRLGRSREEIFADLTAEGVEIALHADGGPQLLVIARTAGEETADELIRVLQELAELDGTAGERTAGEHRGITGYRIGNVGAAAVRSQLLIGTDVDLLKAAVDSILDGDSPSRPNQPGSHFGVSARLNLQKLRTLPNVANGLKVPSDDGGLMAALGGWIDLLRRHQTVTFRYDLDDDHVRAVVRFEGADEESPPAFAGYWADDETEVPAPLLKLPGTIYSTSWYRDYGALWQSRAELVSAQVVGRMEQANEEAAAQFEALGSAVSLSEVVQQFGPRFRIVIAEQPQPPYDLTLRNTLPAAALVIELKDEAAFREMAAPFARVVHLILSFEQKITSLPLEYAGATLQQLSLPHANQDVVRRDPTQYNFRPTHTITRGHFIIGTTPQIVQQTIDVLDGQSAAALRQNLDGRTSEQFVDIRRLADALDGLGDGIVRHSVLTSGLSIETAEHELDIVLAILRLFDTKTVTGVFTGGGFEYRVSVTTAPR